MVSLARPVLLVSLIASASVVHAAKTAPIDPKGSNLISSITACRDITDSASRLACYDASAAKLADAQSKQDVIVLDRADVDRTKRSLFGFSLPHLPFFGNDETGKREAPARPEITEVDAKIRSARAVGYHEWTIVLDDDAVWHLNESPDNDPRPGDAIHIRKAMAGSYFANIARQRAVRANRVN